MYWRRRFRVSFTTGSEIAVASIEDPFCLMIAWKPTPYASADD